LRKYTRLDGSQGNSHLKIPPHRKIENKNFVFILLLPYHLIDSLAALKSIVPTISLIGLAGLLLSEKSFSNSFSSIPKELLRPTCIKNVWD